MPPKLVYNKPYLPPAALVQHLKVKGLTFTSQHDEACAEAVLSRVNYYRFKAYLIPALDHNTNTFVAGSTFTDGMSLYDFDCEFRAICTKYLLKLEVKLRSQLDQTVTAATGNPFWYLYNEYFTENVDYVRSKVASSISRSPDQFAQHYRDNYISNTPYYEDLPPFWIAAELTTFGMLTSLAMALDKSKIGPQRSNDLDMLAQRFGAAGWAELRSWLPLIRDIRNCSSHSNRTWNRNYREPRGFVGNTQRLTRPPVMRNKIYLGLAVIHLMTKDNMLNGGSFKLELQQLLGNFMHVPALEHQMGMPSNWALEPVWK